MTQPSGTRTYGLIILMVLLGVALYTFHERRASIYYPGWFYRFSSTVWCHTSITIRPNDGLPQISHFWHYPGKSVAQLVNDYVSHPGMRETFLNERIAEYETSCYPTWQEAAQDNMMFTAAVKEYQIPLTDWVEEDYKQALTYAALGRGEDGKPAIDTYLLRQVAAETKLAATSAPTPDVREPLNTSGVLCQSDVTHPDLKSNLRAVRFVHPPGNRDLVSRFIRDEFGGGEVLEEYTFLRTVCWDDWRQAYSMMRMEDKLYAQTYLPEGIMTDAPGSRMPNETEYRDIVLEVYFLDERPHIEETYFSQSEQRLES